MEKTYWILQLVRLLALCFVLIIGAYTEIAKGKIYNWLTVPALLLGLALGYLIGSIPPETIPHAYRSTLTLEASFYGMLVGGGLFFILYCLGAMGAGDVKMMGAVGALGGLRFTVWAMFFTTLIGGVMALAIMIWQGRLLEGMRDSLRLLFTMRAKKEADKPEEDSEEDNSEEEV